MKIFKNFWRQEVLDILESRIKEFFDDKLPVHVQYNFWETTLWTDSTPILIYNFENGDPIIQLLWNQISPLFNNVNYIHWSIGLYFATPGSYITWHDDLYEDEIPRLASSTYLNSNWDKNWGGHFLYKSKETEEYYAEIPEYNKMILVETPELHATSITSQSAEPRISLQCFFQEEIGK